MVRFIIRRLLTSGVLLLVISFVTFMLFFLAPKALGIDIGQVFLPKGGGKAELIAIKQKLGLDHSVFIQYWDFLKGIFVGRDYKAATGVNHCPAPCFGVSFGNDTPVWPQITDRFPVTLSLAIGAAILWLSFGVTIGVISALRRGQFFDRAAMTVALAGVSLPVYFTGLLALSVFTFGPHWLRFVPQSGYVNFADNPLQWAHQLILPWIVLAFLYSAGYARLTRAGMLETLGEDYIRTARAKGLPEGVVIRKHALRSALTPIVTIFGLDVGSLLGGAVLTERVFSLPGIGKLSLDAITTSDLYVIMGTVLVAAFFVILANLVVDLLYAVLDPKVRLS